MYETSKLENPNYVEAFTDYNDPSDFCLEEETNTLTEDSYYLDQKEENQCLG